MFSFLSLLLMWLVTKGLLWCSFLYQIRILWNCMWSMLWGTHIDISNFPSSTIANTLKPQPEKSNLSSIFFEAAVIGLVLFRCQRCLTKHTFSLIHICYIFPLGVLLCACILWKSSAQILFLRAFSVTEFDRCRKYMNKRDCVLSKNCFGDVTETYFV